MAWGLWWLDQGSVPMYSLNQTQPNKLGPCSARRRTQGLLLGVCHFFKTWGCLSYSWRYASFQQAMACRPDLFFLHPSFVFPPPALSSPSGLSLPPLMSSACQCCGPVVTQSQPHTAKTWMWLTRSPPSPVGSCELQLVPSPCIQSQPPTPLGPNSPFQQLCLRVGS